MESREFLKLLLLQERLLPGGGDAKSASGDEMEKTMQIPRVDGIG